MSHVFVVEDDADVRSTVVEILKDEGYDVAEFSAAEQVLTALSTGPRPCVVLVDLIMPGMSGQELAAALKENAALASIPLVVVTGSSAPLSEVESLRKPFELADLIGLVEHHCGHRRPRPSDEDCAVNQPAPPRNLTQL